MRAFLLFLLAIPTASAQGPAADDAPAALEAADDAERVRTLLAEGAWHPALADLYTDRDHALAWPTDHARLDARLDAASADGLLPHETRSAERRDLRTADDPVRRDLVLTDALLRLAEALAGLRVDPESIHEGHWFLTREVERRRQSDPADLVRQSLATEDPATAVLAALDALHPPHPEYHALRRELTRRLALDYAAVQPASPRTTVGEAAWPDAPAATYDPDAIARLRLNLERWRWLPHDFGDEHVLVNVPAARLRLREGARTVLDMTATVGQPEPDWQTPVLSDPIRSVAFFPTWTPTVTIQRREIIPQAREDGGQSLYDKGFDVYRGGRRMDPRDVDWSRARAGQYRIVQRGGPQGALGRVKFIMPNPYYILIHDTNTPEEFDGDERALSHGCVRAEDPGALADAILTRTNGWSSTRASEIIDGRPRSSGVRLRERFPVHIVYFTAWPGESGGVDMFGDLYGRDAELAAALGIDLGEPAVHAAER